MKAQARLPLFRLMDQYCTAISSDGSCSCCREDRKIWPKRQVTSDAVDERKSSNCPFILAREVLGIMRPARLEVGLGRDVSRTFYKASSFEQLG